MTMDAKQLEEKLNEAMEEQPIVPVVETPVVPETIKVGDSEYSQDELTRLVGLGKLGAEMEEKWNTRIDRVYPDFTKNSIKLKELEEENQTLKTKVPTEPLTPDAEQSKEALRILKEEFGVVTKGDLEDYYKQRRDEERTQMEQEEYSKQLHDKVVTLQKEVDGTDGRPVFKAIDVLEHMQETGIKDPMKAYKDKYEQELDAWKAEKLVKGEPKDPIITVTKPTAGGKQPNSVRPTTANLQQLLDEALPDR
jgi:hypothetical protein